MASAAPTNLPLFYNKLEPLSSQNHGNFRVRRLDAAKFLSTQHAVPITAEEFPMVSRRMPIVFSVGNDPVPLALMAMNEGMNMFFDADGRLVDQEIYIPAYIRRYPYLLAKLRPESDELSLCFDPTSDTIGPFDDGEMLFDGGEPSELTKGILTFAEQFEQAGMRTGQFVKEVREAGLLMDGEISIQPDNAPQPFVYRGFQMIDEKKVNELRGDQLRKMVQSGMLPLIYAHLFSLSLMRDLFARQMRQGKTPQANVGV